MCSLPSFPCQPRPRPPSGSSMHLGPWDVTAIRRATCTSREGTRVFKIPCFCHPLQVAEQKPQACIEAVSKRCASLCAVERICIIQVAHVITGWPFPNKHPIEAPCKLLRELGPRVVVNRLHNKFPKLKHDQEVARYRGATTQN